MYRRGSINRRFRKRTLLGFFVIVGVLITATLKFNGMPPFNAKEDEEISNCSPITGSEEEIQEKNQQGFGLSHWQKAAAALGIPAAGALIHHYVNEPLFVRPIKTKRPLSIAGNGKVIHYPYGGYRFKIKSASGTGKYDLMVLRNGETESAYIMGPFSADQLEPEEGYLNQKRFKSFKEKDHDMVSANIAAGHAIRNLAESHSKSTQSEFVKAGLNAAAENMKSFTKEEVKKFKESVTQYAAAFVRDEALRL